MAKCKNVSRQLLSLYITHEFLAYYSPKFLSQMVHGNEVKVWFCKDSMMPTFSYGGYHGRTAKNGLPMLGGGELHVRLNKELWEEMRASNNNVEQHRLLVSDVYKQIYAQITEGEQGLNQAMLMGNINDEIVQIKKLEAFIEGSINEKRTEH